jgi:ribose transport system ATP-binding protein
MGVGYLPPDRKREAAFLNRPVAENLAISSWEKIGTGGVLVRKSQELEAYQRWQEPLGIKSASPKIQPIATLSGGNQQKVVLGRWLERESNPLVLVEPTRGVDVGARQEIYSAIRELATQGKAILVVTSDYEEAVQVADRAIVMARGRIEAEFEGSNVTTQGLTDASG